MSLHGNFEVSARRKVIMPADDEDEIGDFHSFQDIRMELNATGHNLTSVLINPRESVFDNIFDEFATEQSAPLEYDSPLLANSSQGGLFGMSSHSGASTGKSGHTSTSTRSKGGSAHSLKNSSNSRYSSNGTMISSTTLYTTTPAEDKQLEQLVERMKKAHAMYDFVRRQGNHSDRYDNHNSINSPTSPRKSATPAASAVSNNKYHNNHNNSMNNMRVRSGSMDSYADAIAATMSTSGPNQKGKGGKWNKHTGDELRTCYNEVPDLFFRSDFSLLNPEIFNETLLIKDTCGEGAKKKHTPLARSGRTYSTEDVLEMMQRQGLDGRSHDILSYYLDLVEVALLRQIWLRSPAFFRALDDIKGLQFQVSETTKVVCKARSALHKSDEAATLDALRVPRLSQRQRNICLLHEKLLSVQRVVQGRAAIIALLDCEDYFSAMELISVAKKVYHEQLAGIVALRQLGRQLDDIDNVVCEVMCNKFVSLAIQWEDTSPPTTTTTGTGHGNSQLPTAAATNMQLLDELDSYSYSRSSSGAVAGAGAGASSYGQESATGPKLSQEASLKQLLQSLLLTERTQSALNMYKNRLLDAIKLIVRTCVMEYLSFFDPSLAYDDNPFDPHSSSAPDGGGPMGTTDTPFAQKVREMSGENFLSCLSMCYEHVMVSVQKAQLFHIFIEQQLGESAFCGDASTAALVTIAAASSNGGGYRGLLPSGSSADLMLAGTPGSLRSLSSTNSLSEQVAPLSFPLGGLLSNGAQNSNSESEAETSSPLRPGGIAMNPREGSQSPAAAISGTSVSPSTRLQSEEVKKAQTQMVCTSKACLTAACDLAQRSISQLISLRKEVNSKLPPEKMKFLWEISLDFVLSLEKISESTAYIMRQSLLSQTKNFLDYLHETCKGKLVATLDNERWVQCDVAVGRQSELDRLSSGKAFLTQSSHRDRGGGLSQSASSNSLVNGVYSAHTSSQTNLTSVTAGGTGGTGCTGGTGGTGGGSGGRSKDKESRPAVVDGVQYKVVWSVMLLTETILTYLEIAFNFSPVTADVINKIVELLRLFNTRTRQLVLGAQAIQSAARLKSISAKHLAVTGQSLGLMNALLPHIRAALLAQIPAKHQLLLTELDRVSHDLIDHHGQIVAKFVAIVGDFVDASATRLRAVDWDHFQGLQCEYFEEVQRNVLALHRVLQAILPPAQIQDVFSRIFALLNRKIPAHFDEIMPSTQTGRQRILDEITHLVTAFSRMKQIDCSALTDSLEDTFRKRYVRDKM